jgi:hypothetical protein
VVGRGAVGAVVTFVERDGSASAADSDCKRLRTALGYRAMATNRWWLLGLAVGPACGPYPTEGAQLLLVAVQAGP